MRRTHEQHTAAVRAENAARIDSNVERIVSAAKTAARPLKQRELFLLTTGMNYTQFQAAVLVAVESGELTATGVTTARRYTAP